MSFTWPTVPYQGSEVTAFAAAYKELAEAVLSEYFDFGGPTGEIAGIEGPYIEKLVVKELLQEGLLYACFIIQQRSGTTGPGTDFVLGNSPIDISDPNLQPDVIKLLGCKWGEFESSFENNIKCGNKPQEPPPDPDDGTCCTGSPTPLEGGILNTWGAVNVQKPFAWVIVEAMKRYLSCDSTPITADDLTDAQKQLLKEIAQKHLDNARTKGYNNYTGQQPGGRGPIVTPLTDAYNQANLRGATSIYRVSFYGDGRTVHKLLGRAKVTADANDNVMCIKDDFDFDYGVRADRSDGSFAGDPITGYEFGENMIGSDGSPHTNLQDVKDDWDSGAPPDGPGSFGAEREMIANAALENCPGGKGRGAPVPINICF